MTLLKKRPTRQPKVEYLEDAEFPGYYGATWSDDAEHRLFLVRLTDMATTDTRNNDDKYMWVSKTMCFFHVGRYKTFQEALSYYGIEKVYKFNSQMELGEWMDNDGL